MSGAPIDGGAQRRALPWRQKIPGLGKALCAVRASAFAGGRRQQNPLYRPLYKGQWGEVAPSPHELASGFILHRDEAGKAANDLAFGECACGDVLAIVDMPDNVSMFALSVAVSTSDFVRTKTIPLLSVAGGALAKSRTC